MIDTFGSRPSRNFASAPSVSYSRQSAQAYGMWSEHGIVPWPTRLLFPLIISFPAHFMLLSLRYFNVRLVLATSLCVSSTGKFEAQPASAYLRRARGTQRKRHAGIWPIHDLWQNGFFLCRLGIRHSQQFSDRYKSYL
jgi:hypothetical protein